MGVVIDKTYEQARRCLGRLANYALGNQDDAPNISEGGGDNEDDAVLILILNDWLSMKWMLTNLKTNARNGIGFGGSSAEDNLRRILKELERGFSPAPAASGELPEPALPDGLADLDRWCVNAKAAIARAEKAEAELTESGRSYAEMLANVNEWRTRAESAEATVAKMREALRWYGDANNYTVYDMFASDKRVLDDGGKRARNAIDSAQVATKGSDK